MPCPQFDDIRQQLCTNISRYVKTQNMIAKGKILILCSSNSDVIKVCAKTNHKSVENIII